MSNILIMHRNFVSSSLLTSQTKSSEIAAAPATNVYDTVRRTKVWRTAGYWEITASNKAIIFRETVGVNLTANIVVSNYTTDATFLTAIKTALEVAGDSTYTVSRDTSTNKIKIASDGLGGGGILQLMWTNVGSTAASTLGYSTAADDTGALTYTADSLRIHTSEWLRWDLGSAINPQAFAIIGTRKDGVRISSTATVTLQGSATDVWTAPAYSQALTWHDDAIAVIGTTGLHSTGLRYWRCKIVDYDNPLGYVEASNIFLGELFEPDEGCVQFPMDIENIDLSKTDQGEWGNRFADVKQITRLFRLDWQYLTKADKETLEELVEQYKTAYPFWLCLDPNQVYSSAYQRFIVHGYFEGLPSFQLDRPNQFKSVWQVRESV